jgi:hypothetical protein
MANLTTLASGSSVTVSVTEQQFIVLNNGRSDVARLTIATGANAGRVVTAQHNGRRVYGPFGVGTVTLAAISGDVSYEVSGDATSQLDDDRQPLTGPENAAARALVVEGRIETVDGAVYALSEVVAEVQATASATTTVLTGAGTYSGYRCTVAAGNITVYDNTAASGKVLVPTTALVVGSYPIFGAGHSGRLAVATGVTVVLSGAATVYAGVEAA